MKQRICFFDLDGTILDVKDGVPESTRRAIHNLTDNGSQAFICTGRSRAFITQEAIDMGFHGMVAACGAYLEYKGNRIYNRELDTKTARKAMEIIRVCGMVPVMEGADYLYFDKGEYTNSVNWYCDILKEQIGDKWKSITGNEDSMYVNKISAKRMPGCEFDRACAELSDTFDYICHGTGNAGHTVEFVGKGDSKAVGMERLLTYLGLPREDVIVFGDSNNDLEMFDFAPFTVAMGNGSEKIKEKADMVTASMWEDGIEKALKELELI